MLETIDQVNWEALNDAYGPSAGTPRRIFALASPNQHERDQALRDLCATIYHQGTIYAASVAAVPFLLELAALAELADRAPTLQVLRALSTGTSFHEAHASLIFNREKSQTAEWQEQVRTEKAWVAAIHEQLAAAVPGLAVVLSEGRPAERLAAASLLGTLQDQPAAVAALARAATDSDPVLSATALTVLGGGDKPPVALFEQCFAGATSELARCVAAIQLLLHCLAKSPAAVEYLLDQLRTPRPDLREAYGALADAGEFLGDLGQALAAAPPAAGAAAFPLLYEQVKHSRYPLSPSETFGVLVLATMLRPPPEGKWSAAALTHEQRLAIRLVADRAWTIDRGVPTTHGNLTDLLEQAGLPRKREEIFTLLAGSPEGVQTPREEKAWSSRKRRPSWKFW